MKEGYEITVNDAVRDWSQVYTKMVDYVQSNFTPGRYEVVPPPPIPSYNKMYGEPSNATIQGQQVLIYKVTNL